ncbi:MAG TPA: Druantia anti-phage system protein DruA [Candidatus Methylomirabilis sp.]|nr:Druantia anti-phage system protein DruA [Candidatus Methylomirabilis sp.]
MDERALSSTPILLRYRARAIGPAELAVIRAVIAAHAAEGRTRISQLLCTVWDWRQPNGALKEYACRDLLLRLEERGHITLPPRRRAPDGPCQQDHLVPPPPPGPLLRAADLGALVVRPLAPAERALWKACLAAYHYLGYAPGAGEQLGYVATLAAELVGCLAWGAAAYRNGPRDTYLGWDLPTKRARLHLVAQNTRFLLLPWVRAPHLASKVLAANCRRLSADWQARYGHGLLLAETFVDPTRFRGTCYRAANWVDLGLTQGAGKRGNRYRHHGVPKQVFVYPLHPRARERLGAP